MSNKKKQLEGVQVYSQHFTFFLWLFFFVSCRIEVWREKVLNF